MTLEIEQKFLLADPDRFVARLAEMGAEPAGDVEQRDTYYNHPARDFAATDEALRIRRTSAGAYLTYKGPKLDSTTKTRREIEVPLAGAEAWPELLRALGFCEVATVAKHRRRFRVAGGPFDVEVSVDRVEHLGWFAELEIVADESQQAAAQETIGRLAGELNLAGGERRSYLELLLQRPAGEA